MKKGTRKTASTGSSWRDIQQANRRSKATSKAVRMRRLKWFFRVSFGVLLLGALVAGAIGLVYLYNSSKEPVAEPLSLTTEIVFETDGVLNTAWFRERFEDVLQADVRELDVSAVKARLESMGQVASASVTVQLPSLLRVKLNERDPLLRVRVRGDDGQLETYLLSRGGHIFQGHGYPVDTLRRLPGVAGLKLKRFREGFAPVEGIEEIAHLLEYTRSVLPSVYRHWEVVDLRDWNSGEVYQPSLVRIRSAHIKELVFSTQNVEEQVKRLAGILEHTQRYQLGQPTFIDLSFGDEAVIRYN